jgi:hypothetical protein
MAAIGEQCERAALLGVSVSTADCRPAIYCNISLALRISAVTLISSGRRNNVFCLPASSLY